MLIVPVSQFSLLWVSLLIPLLFNSVFSQGNEYIRTHVVTLGGTHEEMYVEMKSRGKLPRMINWDAPNNQYLNGQESLRYAKGTVWKT